MKIYLDNNLGVTNVEQEELTQDTIGYNILKVYIPNAVLTPYDTFTCYYGALLQNGRKVGWFAMEARTSTDADYEANYTLYKATLEQCIVSVEGKVYIGCQVLLGNSGNATLIKKNTAVVQFNVRKSVAINNDILVLDPDQTNTDVLESYKNLLENALTTYATKATTYTKTEVNSALALKADKSDTYTKQEVNNITNGLSARITANADDIDTLEGNVTTLQDDVADLKSVQNVVEVVATKSALNSYDTTKLESNDKVQVIADETHDGASTIYNWNGSTWVYVGAYGTNSYTKAESNNKFALKSTAVTHTGNQLKDNNGNNIYPILDDGQIGIVKTNFIKFGKNLYNIDTSIDGYYIGYTSGNMFVNSNFFASDYILIDSTKEYLYLCPIGDPQIAFYDTNKTYISGIHGNPPFAIPTNAKYIRISNLLSCKICQLEYGQSATPYESYCYDFDYPKENTIDMDYNSKHNGIDTSSYTLNAYWTNQGTLYSSSGANALNNITKLKPNTTYKVYPNYALYPNYTWLCQNENKVNRMNISNFGYTITNGTFTTDDTHIYMLTTLRTAVSNNIKVVNGDIPNNNLKYGDNLISMNIENHTFYVGARRQFTKLIDGISEAVKYPNSILYVDDGEYDLVNEYGQDYLDNTTTDVGIVLSNKIHIIFSSNSKVLFNYSGNNSYIHTEFSPFNSGAYGFTLENLNLECSNCRYCVHDERGNTTDDYINKYINCNMSLDNSNNPDWSNPQNIGGGLGSKGYIEIVGCVFNNAITYHNNNGTQTDCKSKVIIKDCYLKSNGIIITGHNSNITKVSEFIITNTHTDYISVQDTIPNVVVYQWNNDIY